MTQLAMHNVTLLVLSLLTLTGMHGMGAAPAQAQTTSHALGSIDGTVVDRSLKSLGGVEVIVLDAHRSVRTGVGGAYRMDSLDAGTHMLRFRRIGLNPYVVTVSVNANEVTGVDVVMDRGVYSLDVVAVVAKSGRLMDLPRGFVDRMRAGTGYYLTEEDIARRRPFTTADLFRHVAGVTIVDGRVVSTRGVNSYLSDPCPEGLPIYLDGILAGGGQFAAKGAGRETLEMISPRDISALEVYRGPAALPTFVAPSACGAVLIWTK